MKKISILIAVAALILALAVPSFAASEEPLFSGEPAQAPSMLVAADPDTGGEIVKLRGMTAAFDIVRDDAQGVLSVYLDKSDFTGTITAAEGGEGEGGIYVNLTDGAVWTVTAPVVVIDIIINDGCRLNGLISENEDGTLTITPLPEAS